MPLTPPIPMAYDAATRTKQHTSLTVGGGAVLVPLVVGGLIAGIGPETSIERGFILFLQMSGMLLVVGIVPALLFAFLREPVMRRLFNVVSQLVTPWGRAATLLIGTLVVFISYAAVAAGLFSLYMWLEGPAHRLSYWQYLTSQSDIVLGVVRIFSVCAFPWLLAALASAWYVNRDLLPGGSWQADAAG
ncbi:hypothetical protein [Hymenobacter psychrophilus]|uniref:Uncharacterized protein n=1 Tax=Hymenobacter psychrophilus TaxID=651662 RepID=A0A1H3FKS8_9BACT|nr:hypothetical protein [Hymenobacter psychrophilus]SDX90744.1 hypothetical protein SAMN04488069_10490 [Hymenobacter psychrophilus]